MELIKVKLDDQAFDDAVHGHPEGQPAIPDFGDLPIYVKKRALQSGLAGAVLTFTVQLPNGKRRRVQTVTTVTWKNPHDMAPRQIQRKTDCGSDVQNRR